MTPRDAKPSLGILTGMRSEAKLLRRAGIDATIEISGATPKGAEAAVARLAAAGCTHLLSFGMAGALDPRLAPGTVLLPMAVRSTDGEACAIDRAWHHQALALLAPENPVLGRLIGVDTPAASAAEKAALRRNYDAVAVDMESHVLAHTAARIGAALLILRVVIDPADLDLPPAALVGVGPGGAANLAALTRSIIRQPGQLPDLVRLGLTARTAEQALLRCVRLGGHSGFGMLAAMP